MSTSPQPSTAAPALAVRHSANSRLLKLLRAAVVGYLLVLLMFTAIQERIMFPATRDPSREVAGPEADYQDVYFPSTDGVQLHGRYFPAAAAQGILLYFHGNADMVGWLDGYARMLRDAYQHSIFVFDYRGYGRSDGKATVPGVLLDGRAAAEKLSELSGVPCDQMIYLGRSLGAGVAIDVATDHPPKALVLQNAFTTVADVAAYHFRWFPVRLLLRVRLDCIDLIGKLQCPILQSHGTDDRLIPCELGKRLYEAANPPKQFFDVHGCGHNDAEPREYYEALGEFLNSLPDAG